jgi:hypothetical protein
MFALFILLLLNILTHDVTGVSSQFQSNNRMGRALPVPVINFFYVLGPFQVGKTEIDGDPTEAFGGIDALFRYEKRRKQ